MSFSAKDFDRLSMTRDIYKSLILEYQDKISKLSEDIVRIRLEIDCIEHCLQEYGHVCSVHED